MQYSLGACGLKDIALAVACPVVSKSPKRNEIVVYGGAVHFSKEFLYKSNGERLYGYVVRFNDREWGEPLKGVYLANLSQEHGIIQATREVVESVAIGETLGILPVHACLAVSALKSFQTLNGEVINY
jgi:D-serine deaminase-like pyridoxal phosphate-dependent protein